MRAMYERLRRLYLDGYAKEMHLNNALKKNWLTKEEYDLIIDSKEIEDKTDTETLVKLQ